MVRILIRLSSLAVAVALVAGCAPAQPTNGHSPAVDEWDAETYLAENARNSAELLKIADPPDVKLVRFVTPLEKDSVWISCLHDAGYDFSPAPGGGMLFPEEQPEELMADMDLALYTCWTQYPVDPKYRAPATEEQDRWLYEYRTTTLIDCLEEHGGAVLGTPPSFQVFVEEDGWSPFSNLSADSDAYYLQGVCLQTPPEFYEQPFW